MEIKRQMSTLLRAYHAFFFYLCTLQEKIVLMI